MSYHIEYGPAVPPQYAPMPKPPRLRIMTATFLLLFAFLVRQFFPSGAEKLRLLLLPGTPTVTQQALDFLMGDLRDGEPLGQAFTAFCTYIIDNDQTLPH